MDPRSSMVEQAPHKSPVVGSNPAGGTKAHAKHRPPSGAARWIPCPGSTTVAPLYPNDPSSHSEAGDVAHQMLEDGIRFGILPEDTQDPDMYMNVRDVLDWVKERKAEYGPTCQVYAEQQYDIPQTGEFGTCDITLVSADVIHIADFKNGFVLTDAKEQMLCYLSGAIAKYGSRPFYRMTVLQPNHNHRDGPYRTTQIYLQDLADFDQACNHSMHSVEFVAGSHCKKTYCPHRGSCRTFKAWCEMEGQDAWYPHEVNAISDDELAQALDHADTLHGVRDEYRKEAMRRIAQHDKRIRGYKLVKSRQQRDFAGDAGRDACYTALLALGYYPDELYERKEYMLGGRSFAETSLLTVAGVERMVKQKYKTFKRGRWKEVWDEYFRPHIREFSGSLTLERDTDGRPAHTRGSEFGALVSAQQVGQVGQVV